MRKLKAVWQKHVHSLIPPCQGWAVPVLYVTFFAPDEGKRKDVFLSTTLLCAPTLQWKKLLAAIRVTDSSNNGALYGTSNLHVLFLSFPRRSQGVDKPGVCYQTRSFSVCVFDVKAKDYYLAYPLPLILKWMIAERDYLYSSLSKYSNRWDAVAVEQQ